MKCVLLVKIMNVKDTDPVRSYFYKPSYLYKFIKDQLSMDRCLLSELDRAVSRRTKTFPYHL